MWCARYTCKYTRWIAYSTMVNIIVIIIIAITIIIDSLEPLESFIENYHRSSFEQHQRIHTHEYSIDGIQLTLHALIQLNSTAGKIQHGNCMCVCVCVYTLMTAPQINYPLSVQLQADCGLAFMYVHNVHACMNREYPWKRKFLLQN